MEMSAPQTLNAADWHAYIRAASSFAVAQARMESALMMGVDFAALNREATR